MRLVIHDNFMNPFLTDKKLSKTYRYANLADLHKYEGTPKEDLDRLKRSILSNYLDYAFFAGDSNDKLNSFRIAGYKEDTKNFFKDIAEEVPIGICFDGHDENELFSVNDERYNEKLFLEYIEMLESIRNVHVFKPNNRDRILINNEVAIYGHSIDPSLVHTYSEKDPNTKIAFRKDLADYYQNIEIDDSTFNILQYHPAQILFDKWRLASKEELGIPGIDMTASGHLHGAMVPFHIPSCLRWLTFHRGLLSPDKKWLPYYIAGFYQENDLIADVTRGIEKVPSTSPEIVKKIYKKIGTIVYSKEYNISNVKSTKTS